MSKIQRSTRFLIAVLLLASLIFISPGVQAAALGVNTLDDELNSDGDCSLREAIQAANTNAAVDACSAGASGSTDTITFSVSGTITLSSVLTVTNGGALVIDGGDNITLDGDDSVQVFLADTGSDLTLKDLTVSKGAASQGAGLLARGKVSLIHSDFAANNATAEGGGVYNDTGGDLYVVDSQFGGNGAIQGAGIYSKVNFHVVNSAFGANGSDDYSSVGGAIYVASGTGTIEKCTFDGNSAFQGGSGLYNAGTVTVSYSSFTNNNSYLAAAIYNSGSLTLENSTVANNSGASGGGLLNVGSSEGSGVANIISSTFSGNAAQYQGGAILNNGSTLYTATVNITNSSFRDNIASGGDGADIFNSTSDSIVNVQNSVFAVTGGGSNCANTITNLGNNIDVGSSCGFGSDNGSQSDIDPMISQLSDNGGPTETLALQNLSPAIDAANPDACPETDQRGASRWGTCDIGAYEFRGTITELTSSANPSVFGQPVTFTAQVIEGDSLSATGDVTFASDGGTIGVVALNGSEQATLTVSDLAVGSHTITASYAGDTHFAASDSQPLTQTVNKAATTTTITSDLPDPSVVGQAVTINVTVAANSPSAAVPDGSVTVTLSGSALSCNAALSGGAGSCQITPTSQGTPTFTASYAGNAKFNGSSDTEAHTVNKADTATTITSDLPDPTILDQTVTVEFTVAAVAPGAGTPTGSVNVTITGGSESCTGTLSGGAGSCQFVVSNVGTRTITASYTGDSNFNTSSKNEDHVVNKKESATTITSDLPDASIVGQPVTVEFSVAAVAPSTGTPSGTVTVTISGGSETCSTALSGGAGSCQLTPTLQGARTITASYAGDASFYASSDTEAHGVNKAETTTTITSDLPDSSVIGQAVTVNFSVAAVAPGSGAPTGSVTVTVSGGSETCSGTLSSGSGSCQIVLTETGNRTLTATYPGDSNYNGSAGDASHVVNKANTTTDITSDLPDPSVVGQAITVEVTVAAVAPGSGAPSGTVAVAVNGGSETCNAVLSGGVGSCQITLTGTGAFGITATYPGDTRYNGSSDEALHQVNKADTAAVITSDLPDPSVVGQAVTVQVSVPAAAPGSGTPTGSVAVTISGGSEACNVTLSGGTGNCQLTLTSTGARTITASYAGDSKYNGSSGTEAHQVNKADTTTVITSDTPDPSVVGQTFTVNFMVTSNAPGSGTPTGFVTVTVSGGTATCDGALSNGSGSCLIILNSPEAYTLTATYNGSANYNVSEGKAEHVVNKISTTTTITSDVPDPSVVGQAVTVAFTVASVAPGSGTPTGSVTVTVSGGSESCEAALSAGSGSCQIVLTSPGARTLTATYNGSANYAVSASSGTAHQVMAKIFIPLVSKPAP